MLLEFVNLLLQYVFTLFNFVIVLVVYLNGFYNILLKGYQIIEWEICKLWVLLFKIMFCKINAA